MSLIPSLHSSFILAAERPAACSRMLSELACPVLRGSIAWLDLSPLSRNTRNGKSNGRDKKKQDSADS